MKITSKVSFIICFVVMIFFTMTFCLTGSKTCEVPSNFDSKINETEFARSEIIKMLENVEKINYDLNITSWQQCIKILGKLTASFIGKEKTVIGNDADYIIKKIIMILDYLQTLDQIWKNFSATEKIKNLRQIVTIIETISVWLNTRIVDGDLLNGFRSQGYVDVKANHYNYNNVIEDKVFELNISIPAKAFNQINNQSKVALTMVRLPFLQQNMTHIDHPLVFKSILTIHVGTSRKKIQLNYPNKLKIFFTDEDGFNNTRKCVFMSKNSDNWSGLGCNIIPSISKPIICECEQLHNIAVFALADDSFKIKNEEFTTTFLTTPQTVPTSTSSTKRFLSTQTPFSTSTPAKALLSRLTLISNKIQNVLENTTKEGIHSTDQWNGLLEQLTDLVSSITLNDETFAEINKKLAHKITNSSLNSLNQLIENLKNVWQNLSILEQKNAISKILKMVSRLSVLMNAKQSGKLTVLAFSSIEMHTNLFVLNKSNHIHFVFNKSATIQMPISAINLTNIFANSGLLMRKHQGKIAISAVLLSNISQYLSSGSLLPNSAFLSITVEKERESLNLKNGHKLMFVVRNRFRLVFRDQPRCSFWNLSTNHWSTKGCKVNRRLSNRSSTVCECNHLTDFAALADVSNREKPSFAKSLLTYISSTINCFFLFASILFTLKFNRTKYMLYDDQFKVKTKRFWLNLNVIIWLLVSHLLIMFGMDRTENQILCKITSLLLLYSLLTAFNFTLMLSIHLYLSTSKRHLFNYVSFCNFAFLAHLFPLLFIIVLIVYIYAFETERNMTETTKSLTGEYFCWISSSKYPRHVWIFVVPVTAIILINCCLLGAILSNVPEQSRKVQIQIINRFCHKKAAPIKQNPLVNWYLIGILLFNFGFPWLLYVFYINEQMGIFFSYFFIAINFTQGVALFAEQIYVYKSNPRRKKERPSESSNRSTCLTSVD